MSRPQAFTERPQDMPTKAELARLRVLYVKDRRLAYLGHLDLISTIERCVRRSGLPFSIGNGFARRMRIQFSSALPVGASSSCEYFDLSLIERVDSGEALAALRRATPSALAPQRAAYVDGRLPALEAWLGRASWEVLLPAAPFSADELLAGVGAVCERGTIEYMRGDKPKRVDLAQTLVDARAREGEGELVLELDTRLGAGGGLRPQVLLDAAVAAGGLASPVSVRVRRVAQCHEEDGRIVEPFGASAPEGRPPVC